MRATRMRVIAGGLLSAAIAMAPAYEVMAAGDAASRSFAWYGQVVSVDPPAKQLTVRADVRDSAATYLQRFKPGDRVVLVWAVAGASGGDASQVLAAAAADQAALVEDGYMTSGEFVAVDAAQKTVTFTAKVPDSALQGTLRPGEWIRVTTPTRRSGLDTIATSVAMTDKPAPMAARMHEPPRVERPVAAPLVPVVANGGISGTWEVRYKDGLAVSHYASCALAQDGPRIGGVCKSPGAPDSPATGSAAGTAIELQIPPGGLVYKGTLDASGKTILGTVEVSRVELHFQATKN